jgi:hypothetical protein
MDYSSRSRCAAMYPEAYLHLAITFLAVPCTRSPVPDEDRRTPNLCFAAPAELLPVN